MMMRIMVFLAIFTFFVGCRTPEQFVQTLYEAQNFEVTNDDVSLQVEEPRHLSLLNSTGLAVLSIGVFASLLTLIPKRKEEKDPEAMEQYIANSIAEYERQEYNKRRR